ncbi:MAG TPA: TPM domain-containing protein [Methylophilaceae bacterium]|nr:TPM domain-containing protein [Methylophilaceae bacterium]
MMRRLKRHIQHLLSAPWQVHRYFSRQALTNIKAAIRDSERQHAGQIRFAVEVGLHPYALWQGKTPRQRAIELFARLGVWDTAHNNGVLIYLLLADHDVEIVADRGIHAHVGATQWEHVCREMESMFRRGEFEAGVLFGIERIGTLLSQHFPPEHDQANELSDAPVLL